MKINLLIILLFLLTACSSTNKPIINTKVETVDMFHPPLPSPVFPSDIKFTVITQETTKVWNEENKKYLYFGMTDQDYLSFADWLIRIKIYIEKNNALLCYYRNNKDLICNKLK